MTLPRVLSLREIIASIQRGTSVLTLRDMLRLRHGDVSEGGSGVVREELLKKTTMAQRKCIYHGDILHTTKPLMNKEQ